MKRSGFFGLVVGDEEKKVFKELIPGVRFRIVDFDGGQVLHAVVAADRPKTTHVRHERDAASSDVHRCDVAPPDQVVQNI